MYLYVFCSSPKTSPITIYNYRLAKEKSEFSIKSINIFIRNLEARKRASKSHNTSSDVRDMRIESQISIVTSLNHAFAWECKLFCIELLSMKIVFLLVIISLIAVTSIPIDAQTFLPSLCKYNAVRRIVNCTNTSLKDVPAVDIRARKL